MPRGVEYSSTMLSTFSITCVFVSLPKTTILRMPKTSGSSSLPAAAFTVTAMYILSSFVRMAAAKTSMGGLALCSP